MVNYRDVDRNTNTHFYTIPRFSNLCKVIGNIKDNELITISARVGCGKTTLALNLFSELAKVDKCGYISYEMNTTELINKIRLFDKHPHRKNMGFDDSCETFDVEYIREMIKTYGFKFIFIDYLQLMGGNIKKNTRALKQLCREQNVIVFMLAQLNRKAENKEPQLSMLKDSGTIEQDSDEVGFIKEHSLKIAKNRKASVGEIGIEFDKENSYFYESDEYIETRQELIDEFNKMCCEYLDSKHNETTFLAYFISIRDFLKNEILPFDKNLYEELNKVFIDIMGAKTDDEKFEGVGIENVSL